MDPGTEASPDSCFLSDLHLMFELGPEAELALMGQRCQEPCEGSVCCWINNSVI